MKGRGRYKRKGAWTKRQIKLLRKEYRTCEDPRELARRLGKTYKAVATRAKILGLKRKFKAGSWKPDEDKILTKLYPKMTNQEIGERMGVKASAIDARAFKLGLKKDPEWRYMCSMVSAFQKGSVPANKGRRQKEYMSKAAIERTKATRFKKGQLPKNTLCDGAIRIRRTSIARGSRQYKVIRIALGKWVELSRYNWEKKHGPIPKGMRLHCKSKDPLNCDPGNWELISGADAVRRNSGSLHLKDGYVAMMICGKNNMDLFQEILKDKKLIELKRQQIILKRTVNEQNSRKNR